MQLNLLGAKLLFQEYRSGDLRLLAITIVVAVACLTAMTTLVSRLELALVDKTGELLGGDRILRSNQPISQEMKSVIQALDLRQSSRIRLFSMLQHEDAYQLISLYSVDSKFPLKGSIQISTVPTGPMYDAQIPINPGEIWLSPRLVYHFKVKIGELVQVGQAKLKFTKILRNQPGGLTNAVGFASHAMIHQQDLATTELLIPGSRIRYETYFSGDSTVMKLLDKGMNEHLRFGDSYIEAAKGRESVQTTLATGNQFLHLALFVNVLLAGITLVCVAKTFINRQTQQVALMRCMGSTSLALFSQYIVALLLLAFSAGVIGSVVGWGLQSWFAQQLQPWFNFVPNIPWWQVLGYGATTAIALLLGFALPHLIRLISTPPGKVINQVSISVTRWELIGYFLSLLILIGLIYWPIQDWQLTKNFLVFMIGIGGAVYLILQSLWQYIARRITLKGTGWRLSVLLLVRNPQSIIQILVFSALFFVVSVLFFVQSDLLSSWQAQLKPNTPNHFVINISPAKVKDFENFIAENNIPTSKVYPVIRGRLTHINKEPVGQYFMQPGRRQGFNRTLNLTYAEELPSDNTIIAGRWFDAKTLAAGFVSIEKAVATRVGLKVGDEVTFEIAEDTVKAVVSSIREAKWDSFLPNFYFIFSPETLHDYAVASMASLYIEKNKLPIISNLVKNFPNVSVIDVKTILSQITMIIDTVSNVVWYIWWFTICMGAVLLFAIILLRQNERKQTNSILKNLGMLQSQIDKVNIYEYLNFAALTIFLGNVSAVLMAKVLIQTFLNMPFSVAVWEVVGLTLSEAMILCLLGILANRFSTK